MQRLLSIPHLDIQYVRFRMQAELDRIITLIFNPNTKKFSNVGLIIKPTARYLRNMLTIAEPNIKFLEISHKHASNISGGHSDFHALSDAFSKTFT